jgi:hypothetical protein
LLCVLQAATLAGNAAAAGPAGEFATLLKDSRVTAALQALREDDAVTLREQIAITQILAPPFMEATRAKDYAH